MEKKEEKAEPITEEELSSLRDDLIQQKTNENKEGVVSLLERISTFEVTYEHLVKTKIGKVVNPLTKWTGALEEDKKIKEAAEKLIAAWKEIDRLHKAKKEGKE